MDPVEQKRNDVAHHLAELLNDANPDASTLVLIHDAVLVVDAITDYTIAVLEDRLSNATNAAARHLAVALKPEPQSENYPFHTD